MPIVALILLFLSLSARAESPPASVAAAPTHQILESLGQAERDFEGGRFSESALTVDSLLASEVLGTDVLRARAALLKARLSLAFERRDEIPFWLERLCRLNTHISPDAMRDPPDLMGIWKQTRLKCESEKSSVPVMAPTPPPAEVAPFSKFGKVDRALRTQARFWVGLIPFGVGHFTHGLLWEGAAFSVAETSLVLTTSGLLESLQQEDRNLGGLWRSEVGDRNAFYADRSRAYNILGVVGFLGLYGYELHSLLPELMRDNPAAAEVTRFALSFAPFGAAQMKNGEGLKALAFASAELAFLTLSTSLPREGQRSWCRFFLLGSLAGGAIDGWLNHSWERQVTHDDVWRVGLAVERGLPAVRMTWKM